MVFGGGSLRICSKFCRYRGAAATANVTLAATVLCVIKCLWEKQETWVFICSIITLSVYFHHMWRKHQKTSLTKHIHSLLNWLKVCGQSHSVNVTFHVPLILPHVLVLDCPCSLAPSVSKLFTVEAIFI